MQFTVFAQFTKPLCLLFLPVLAAAAAAAETPGSAAPAGAAATQPAPIYQAWPFTAKEAAKRQTDTAKALGVPKELSLDLGHKLVMKMLLIPAGKFLMGSTEKEQDFARGLAKAGHFNEFFPDPKGEGPPHEVTITKPFYLSANLVTKGQFAAFVADANYTTDAEKSGGEGAMTIRFFPGKDHGKLTEVSWKKHGFDQTDDHPVVMVSCRDALAFCAWASQKTSQKIQLPSEAQWEWACRAGVNTIWLWGSDADAGRGWANLYDQSGKKKFSYFTPFAWDDGFAYTSPVGKFKPNAFGLYDMEGNVWQWGADWYDPEYYADAPKEDPPGPRQPGKNTGNQAHILRGGSWYSNPWYGRIANRFSYNMDGRTCEMGFRVFSPEVEK